MRPHATIPPRAAAVPGAAAVQKGRGALARACLAAGVLAAAAAGPVAAGAGPAAAAPAVLYAAPTAAGTGDCSAVANACTLSTALGQVAAGGVIELVVRGGFTAASRYVGNWAVTTSGTTASAPVTIEAAPGLSSQPVLDGDGPNAPAGEICSTASCTGPVLTVPTGQFVALSGITIADANNTGPNGGGGLDNAGTVTITGSTFTGNTASGSNGDGGAIDNADGSGLGGTGTITITDSTFTGNTATNGGGAIDSSFGFGSGGSVTVTGSTFTGNSATNDGGAIDSGDNSGGGSVTVTASTFAGNTAGDGGAIDSGDADGGGSGGTVTVTASTFTGNTASFDGGAIDSGGPGGTVTVTASTFAGNTAKADGNTIDSGDHLGTGTVQVAGDLFDGSCNQAAGTWTDGGYNAGTDTTCFASTPAAGDKSDPAVGRDLQTALTGNGGPTQTIKPTTGNPAVGLIPDPATITLGSNKVALCPAVDQRGYPSAAGTKCDAGAVQTSGWPPQVSGGTHRPTAHAAEGYRLGETGNTWKLYLTHPGTAKVSFTGKVSVPAGTLGHLSVINPTTGHKVTGTGTAITFTLPDSGTVTGFSFTTSTTVAKITFTLNIGGHPATTSQIFLGGKATHPATGSPLTFTR